MFGASAVKKPFDVLNIKATFKLQNIRLFFTTGIFISSRPQLQFDPQHIS